MCNLPPGTTDKDMDEAAPGYFEPPGQECSNCGHTISHRCGVWVEPDNMGFSGWDNGQWLCEECAEEWQSGVIAL